MPTAFGPKNLWGTVHANLRAAKGAREVCLEIQDDKLLRQLHSPPGIRDNKVRANRALPVMIVGKNDVSPNVIGRA